MKVDNCQKKQNQRSQCLFPILTGSVHWKFVGLNNPWLLWIKSLSLRDSFPRRPRKNRGSCWFRRNMSSNIERSNCHWRPSNWKKKKAITPVIMITYEYETRWKKIIETLSMLIVKVFHPITKKSLFVVFEANIHVERGRWKTWWKISVRKCWHWEWKTKKFTGTIGWFSLVELHLKSKLENFALNCLYT